MFPIYQSDCIHVDLTGHIATLTFTFPLSRYQSWDWTALHEWEQVVEWLHTSCRADILILRSGTEDGFCRGLHPSVLRNLHSSAERAALAWRGQQLVQKLTQWPGVSVAQIDGICRGIGWEFALACDYRLAVQRLRTRIELPQGLTCFGGSALLRYRHSPQALQKLASGATLSAQEACQLGLVDHLLPPADGDRALSRFLQQLGPQPSKRPLPPCWLGLADERRRFAAWNPRLPLDGGTTGDSWMSSSPFPHCIGVWGDIPALEDWLLEAIQRGTAVLSPPMAQRCQQRLADLEQRGFCTPWEKSLLGERLRSIRGIEDLAEAEVLFVAPQYQPWELVRWLAPTSLVVWVQPPGWSPLSYTFPSYNTKVKSPRIVRICFLRSHHVALLPEDEMAEASWQRLVACFQQGDYAVVVFPPHAHILTSAA
jgi:enoyl-CoA hydratase/carnithine racemase